MLRQAIRRPRQRGQQISQGASLPAPIEGWDASSPIARMSDKRALVLDNFFPTARDVRVRRGHQIHAGGMGSGVVDSLLPYHGLTSAASKLFAATSNKIYDITTAGNGSSSVTSLNSNRWQHVNFTTSGGKYLWICNGADAPQHYNGSAWAAPSLSLTTFPADNIINVSAHKHRLWVVFKDSTVAGYLATGAVAGTVTNFQFGSLFTKGGYLVATATWTRDGGSGEDDLFVAISSQGQVAVYAGTDPSSATTWELVGVFDIAPPIGYRCFRKVGGDLAIVTIDGVLPLSLALSRDRGALADIALTKRIRTAMNQAARDYKSNYGWELMPYPQGGYALLNVPSREGQLQYQFVVNTETGAWCRFTGQNANCWEVFRDQLYFGGNSGFVYKADQTALDVLTPITAIGQGAYNYYNSPGLTKEFKLIQTLLTTDADTRPSVGISTDFKDNATIGTPVSASEAGATFDSALFDDAVFPVEGRTIAALSSISGDGFCASVHFRAQTGRAAGVSLWGISQWGKDGWSYSASGEQEVALNGFQMFYEKGLVL